MNDGRESLLLRVNGKTDATSVGDLATQVLLAHLPMLMKPEAPDVLVVGLGSGVTVGSALRHPDVKRVDVVEISPEVIEATRKHFGPVNNHALDDARTHLTLEDAKSFLQTTDQKYDVIITEPSNPWMAGVAAVFSQEFYEDVRNRLKPGGLAAQWLQTYETDDRTVDLVVSTFSEVFPFVGIWHAGATDIVLIGSMEPFRPDASVIARRFQDPLVRADLERVGISALAPLLSLELIPFGEGVFVPEPGTPVHSDFRPRLEYASQKAFFTRDEATKIMKISEARDRRPRWTLSSPSGGGPLGTNEFRAAGDLFRVSSIPEPEIFRSQMRRWLELEPGAVDPLRLLVALERSLSTPDAEAVAMMATPGLGAAAEKGDLLLLRAQVDDLMRIHRERRTAFYLPPTVALERKLQMLIELDPANRRVHRARLAEVQWDRGDDTLFLATALKAFSMDSPDNGPYDFTMDARAPRLVILRMLRLFELRQDWKMVEQLIVEGVRKGFLGLDAQIHEPELEHHARRLNARISMSGRAR